MRTKPRLYIRLDKTLTSYVLYTPKFVYKIKRSVKMRYFDFTQKTSRFYFSYKELSINKSFNPKTYLSISFLILDKSTGIVKIVDKEPRTEDRNLYVIEHALKMRRLDPKHSLRELLKEGKITDKELKLISCAIINLHVQAKSDDVVSSFGVLEMILFNLSETYVEIEDLQLKTKINYLENIARMKNLSEKFLNSHKNLFNIRANPNFVKHLHGDLRLDQLFIEGEEVSAIDAVESVPRFYNCDIVSDLAFLCVELEAWGYKKEAQGILKFYSEESKVEIPKDLFTYYLYYRSLIRVKINLYKLLNSGIQERELSIEKIKKYSRLALTYFNLLILEI